jgi:hypothetical protein
MSRFSSPSMLRLKVDFQGSRVTSHGGLILVRELDERLGLGDLIAEHLSDARRGKNTQLPLLDLFRQSVYSRVAGYEDVNDGERLSQDPAFRLIGSEKAWDRGVALTSRLQTFETETLAEEENFVGLARIDRELIGGVGAMDSAQRVVLDMDSTEIPLYGEQENSAYNALRIDLLTRCCCSIAKVTVWLPSSGPATSTVPTAGKTCCCRRLNGSSRPAKRCCSALTPLLRSLRSTRRWKSGA